MAAEDCEQEWIPHSAPGRAMQSLKFKIISGTRPVPSTRCACVLGRPETLRRSEVSAHLVDCKGEFLGGCFLQGQGLLHSGGPHDVAVAAAHRQQSQGPSGQKPLPRSVINLLRPHARHNASLVIAPGKCSQICTSQDASAHSSLHACAPVLMLAFWTWNPPRYRQVPPASWRVRDRAPSAPTTSRA